MKDYDTIIEGIGTLPKGDYTSICVEGVGKLQDDISFTEMVVSGTCKANGKLEGEKLEVEGSLTVKNSVKMKTLHVDGIMRSDAGNVYANRIDIDGILKCQGEVSADRIVVDGCIQAELLTGDVISINYQDIQGKSLVASFITSLFDTKKLFPGVNHIECTRLEASHLDCDLICAQEVILSEHCHVDVIECDGTISLDSTCRVKEMRGDYTLIQR